MAIPGPEDEDRDEYYAEKLLEHCIKHKTATMDNSVDDRTTSAQRHIDDNLQTEDKGVPGPENVNTMKPSQPGGSQNEEKESANEESSKEAISVAEEQEEVLANAVRMVNEFKGACDPWREADPSDKIIMVSEDAQALYTQVLEQIDDELKLTPTEEKKKT